VIDPEQLGRPWQRSRIGNGVDEAEIVPSQIFEVFGHGDRPGSRRRTGEFPAAWLRLADPGTQ
jgi:hypothetical protein